MNCHGDKKGNENQNPLKHMIHMVICCGLPVVIILSLPYIGRFSPKVAGMLGFIAPFLCPIMMVGMMGMMFKGNNKPVSKARIDDEYHHSEPSKLNKPIE